jgi:hypothetical protein
MAPRPRAWRSLLTQGRACGHLPKRVTFGTLALPQTGVGDFLERRRARVRGGSSSSAGPIGIIQPPIARTSSDTQRLGTYKGRPTEPTSSLKTCMNAGSSTRASPSRKRRSKPKPRGHCPRLQPAPPLCLPSQDQRPISVKSAVHLRRVWPQKNAENAKPYLCDPCVPLRLKRVPAPSHLRHL